MKLLVSVKPGAKVEEVERVDETHFRVSVKAPAREGKANEAVLRILARHFRLARTRLTLLHGQRSKNKVVELKES